MTQSIEQAKNTYNIDHWSDGFFDINEKGHVVAYPDRKRDQAGIDLVELVGRIREQHAAAPPILIRFNDILKERLNHLLEAFDQAIRTNHYKGQYRAVYPIKVNQQRAIVEKILHHNKSRIGLEAGSKPELMAVLALCNPEQSIIICNGYKDRAYIRLALIGQKLGHRVYLILEKLSELAVILEESRNLNVEPLLGIRVRLASVSAGKWQNTGGEKSKFGLSAIQVLSAIDTLKAQNRVSCLKMMHFMLGSQIANIRDIQRGMRECARYYAEFHRLGVPIECVNVGGGLGVDYEGTRSRSSCSMNYSIEEYAHNVVHTLQEICVAENLPHPDIITESGRAMTAHHAVLITNIIGIESKGSSKALTPPEKEAPRILHDLWQTYLHLTERAAIEVHHDVSHFLHEAQTMYVHGLLGLEDRAQAEAIYLATELKVRERLSTDNRAQRELLDDLNEKLASKLFGNFSLFQSLPDIWAINQIFPILPLSQLDQPLTQRGILQDLTCDSDGRIDDYINGQGLDTSLRLPEQNPDHPYLIGIFLVGAYQEILGDIHNLFGDTHSIHVQITADGTYTLCDFSKGETAAQVLKHVHFERDQLMNAYQDQLAKAQLSKSDQTAYLEELRIGLDSYTYFE